MQKLTVAATAALALTTAPLHAAGFDTVVEPAPAPAPVVIEEEPRGTAQGLIVPLVLLALVGVAVAMNDDDDDNGEDDNPPQTSDSRLKTDIVEVGTAANGLPLYQFRYKGLPTVYEGVMAQDVLAHDPAAVTTGWHGFYQVDYGRLGLEMREVR